MTVDLGWLVVAIILSFVAGVAFVGWRVNKATFGLMDDQEKELRGYRKLILRILGYLEIRDSQASVEKCVEEIKRFLDDPMNWNYYK